MKSKNLLSIGFLIFLAGCSSTLAKDETSPELILTKHRIHVDVNQRIDYLSYVDKAIDDVDGDLKQKVTFNEIDTSQKGHQIIEYVVSDKAGNESKKRLEVDVVPMYKNGIFSPMEVEAVPVKNPEDVTVLVNKIHSIPEGWKPTDLEPSIDNPNQKLRKEANEAYTRFYKAAKAQGIPIYSISGYRVSSLQERYWKNMCKVYGEEYASEFSAYPNRSEHQLGLAMDVSFKTTGDRLSEAVADSKVGKFIVEHGYEYGFILRYPHNKVTITNYGYEPWHIRYVGQELATKLHHEGLTLEEYYKE